MADSAFPWPESWWTDTGKRDGNDWVMPAGATFVPWASQAVPVGGRQWTIEFQYDATADTVVAIRHNPFSEADENKQVGQVALGTVTLSAGTNVTRTADISLGESGQPLWTPSFLFQSGGEVRFHSLKVYETATPAGSGASVSVWDGAAEQACAVSVWDGSSELSADIDFVA